MKPKELVQIATYAGEIMLSNGAEISRVEDTITRILRSHGSKGADTFVVPTGIFTCIEDEAGEITIIKRIKKRTIHLEKISQVNNFSRKFVDGDIGYEEALLALKIIDDIPPYSTKLRTIASGIACGSFTYMFGGNLYSSTNSLFTGMLVSLTVHYLNKLRVSSVLTNLIGGALIALSTLLIINLGLGERMQLDKIIIGGIMPLVPGLGLTNGIRDAFEGDYMSATSRLLDALLVAVSIATGVGSVFKVFMYFFGGLVL